MNTSFMQQAAAVAKKDLRIEVRGKEALNTVAPFVAMTLISFAFAFGPGRDELQGAAPALLWLSALFAALLAVRRAYEAETETGALEGLVLTPADRAAIYLGKLAALFIVLIALQAISVLLIGALFGFGSGLNLPLLAAGVMLGTLGLAIVGSFYSALAAVSRAREALLPLLVMPVVAPLIIAAVRVTQTALGDGQPGTAGWMRMLIGFDVVSLAVAAVAFEHIVEE